MTKQLFIRSLLFAFLGLLSLALQAQDKPKIEVKLDGKIADVKAGISIKKLPKTFNVEIDYPHDSVSKVELILVRGARAMTTSEFQNFDDLNSINLKDWLNGKLSHDMYKNGSFKPNVSDRLIIVISGTNDKKPMAVWNDHFVD